MKKFTKIFAVMAVALVGLVGVFGLAGCSKENLLTVATNAEFPPFEYMEGKEFKGFDMEFIEAIAKEMGYDGVEIKHMDFNAVIPSVQTGEAKVAIAGITVDEKRAKAVDFSDTYFNAAQAIIYKGEVKEFASEQEVFAFLKDKKIGVARGFSGDLMISEKIEKGELGSAKVERYPSGALATEDLVSGKVDAVVIDKEVAKAIAKKYEGVQADDTDLGSEKYAIAVKKGDKETLDAVNKAIDNLKANGEFDKIVAKYFN